MTDILFCPPEKWKDCKESHKIDIGRNLYLFCFAQWDLVQNRINRFKLVRPVSGFLNGLWEKTTGQPQVETPEVLEHYWSGRTTWPMASQDLRGRPEVCPTKDSWKIHLWVTVDQFMVKTTPRKVWSVHGKKTHTVFQEHKKTFHVIDLTNFTFKLNPSGQCTFYVLNFADKEFVCNWKNT